MTDDEKERRVVRARPPRTVVPEPAEPREPRPLAAGSEQFGRTMPEAVAAELARARLKRDETTAVAFGDGVVSVEQRYGLVVLILPDGSRAVGTPEQARELANVLLASLAAKR